MDNSGLSEITTYQAGATQAFVHRELQKICDDILRPYEISKMQWLIIGNVLDTQKKGIRISDLADKLGTTISFLTTSVNLLEARGILKRLDNVNDTRSKLIVVSDTYVPKCKKIEITLRDGLRNTIYSDVDPAEFRIYIKVLLQLAHVNNDKPRTNRQK